jgi:transposase InsO family protein
VIRVKRRLNSTDVVDTLTDLFILRGPPRFMRSGNGAEFIAEKVRAWIAAIGAKTAFIEPGSPRENGSCESFNARFRDEFLNGEVFSSVCKAQIRIEKWRRHDNTVRPHSALGYRPSTGNHRPNGPEAHHAPTFKPDCSMGAVHL